MQNEECFPAGQVPGCQRRLTFRRQQWIVVDRALYTYVHSLCYSNTKEYIARFGWRKVEGCCMEGYTCHLVVLSILTFRPCMPAYLQKKKKLETMCNPITMYDMYVVYICMYLCMWLGYITCTPHVCVQNPKSLQAIGSYTKTA